MTTYAHPAFDNRVSRALGVEIPIVQAPMGWIARSALASAVSATGACGIIETSSGELDVVKREIQMMRELTDKPFGVNIAQAFVRDPAIAEFVIEQGVKFVTTSAGSPTKYTSILKSAGLTVFHVVPTLSAALKAVDAGVDGLVVEGAEGGGFKSPTPVSTMVLLPLVRERVRRPADRGGWDHRRTNDGGGVRPRGRRGPDGHPHGLCRRVPGSRQLEAGDHRRRRDRHPLLERAAFPGVARPAYGANRAAPRRRAQRLRGLRGCPGALLRR
ncbi:MAG: nitronate monooxygenase [Ilumatobacteraceae bacterium]